MSAYLDLIAYAPPQEIAEIFKAASFKAKNLLNTLQAEYFDYSKDYLNGQNNPVSIETATEILTLDKLAQECELNRCHFRFEPFKFEPTCYCCPGTIDCAIGNKANVISHIAMFDLRYNFTIRFCYIKNKQIRAEFENPDGIWHVRFDELKQGILREKLINIIET